MKRRGFLQSLVGFVGVALAPAIPAKEKAKIVNAKPGIYETGIVDNCFSSQFDYLTIDHFGAKDTLKLSETTLCTKAGDVTKSYIDHMVTGITWISPADWFPQEAIEGHAFYFTPKTYLGYQLDQETIGRLECCYIFTDTGWRPFIGLSRTEDINWDHINQMPNLFPPAPHI